MNITICLTVFATSFILGVCLWAMMNQRVLEILKATILTFLIGLIESVITVMANGFLEEMNKNNQPILMAPFLISTSAIVMVAYIYCGLMATIIEESMNS